MGAAHTTPYRVVRPDSNGNPDDIVVEDAIGALTLSYSYDQVVVSIVNRQGAQTQFTLCGAGLHVHITEKFATEKIQTIIEPLNNDIRTSGIKRLQCVGAMWMLRLERMGETNWWGCVYTDGGSDRISFAVGANEEIQCVTTAWPH